MPKLALILYAGFLFVAFVWRSWLQYRRTGASGVRHPPASAAPLEWLASVLVIVGFVAMRHAAHGRGSEAHFRPFALD